MVFGRGKALLIFCALSWCCARSCFYTHVAELASIDPYLQEVPGSCCRRHSFSLHDTNLDCRHYRCMCLFGGPLLCFSDPQLDMENFIVSPVYIHACKKETNSVLHILFTRNEFWAIFLDSAHNLFSSPVLSPSSDVSCALDSLFLVLKAPLSNKWSL